MCVEPEDDIITYGLARRNDQFYLVGRYYEDPEVPISHIVSKVIRKVDETDVDIEACDHNCRVPKEGETSWEDFPYSNKALKYDLEQLIQLLDVGTSFYCDKKIIVHKGEGSNELTGEIRIINNLGIKHPKRIDINYDYSENIDIKIDTSAGMSDDNVLYSIKWNSMESSEVPPNLFFLYSWLIPTILEDDEIKDLLINYPFF